VAGVDWVIAKPFTAERIAELVSEINARTAAREENLATAAA
jgi:hypothetical protein